MPPYVDETARGRCYDYALKAFMSASTAALPPEWHPVLCHGIVHQTGTNIAMGHAWIEVEPRPGLVFVRDNLLPRSAVERETYYRVGRVVRDSVKRYTRLEAALLATEHEHPGPWDERIAAAAHVEG